MTPFSTPLTELGMKGEGYETHANVQNVNKQLFRKLTFTIFQKFI